MVNSLLGTGLQGISTGMQGMQRAAQDIARAGTTQSADGPVEAVVAPAIDLKLYKQSVEASVKVVKTADEVLGTLLDTMA